MRIMLVSISADTRFGAITPLGVGYVAAATRAAGHEVQLLDICFENDVESAIRRQIATWPPDVIGVSVRNLDNTLYLAPMSHVPQLKAVVDTIRSCTDVPVILGGSGFSLMPEMILRACNLRLGIVGEGENAFPQLLDSLESGADLQSVPGLAYLEGNGYYQNPPVRIMNLNSLPQPAHDLFDERYRLQREPPSIGNLQTKRGCRYHCLYCTYPLIEGRTLRLRDPEHVAEEMGQWEAESGLTRVDFVDNVFNDPHDHALAVCQALIRQKAKLPWGCSMRPDQISPELVAAMLRAGCRWVELGADAVSDQMLQVLRKGFDFDTLRKSLDLLKSTDIEVALYVLIGAPGENRETLAETLMNLELLDPPWAYLMPGLRIYPGTPLAGLVCESLQTPDLLEPTFYLSPDLGDSGLEALFQKAAIHENWIVLGVGSAEIDEVKKR